MVLFTILKSLPTTCNGGYIDILSVKEYMDKQNSDNGHIYL